MTTESKIKELADKIRFQSSDNIALTYQEGSPVVRIWGVYNTYNILTPLECTALSEHFASLAELLNDVLQENPDGR